MNKRTIIGVCMVIVLGCAAVQIYNAGYVKGYLDCAAFAREQIANAALSPAPNPE